MAASVNNVVCDEPLKNMKTHKIPRKSVFDLLWKLSDYKSDVRINAVSSIIRLIAQKQSDFEKSTKNEKKCPDFDYVIERLVNGLCSSRAGVRQGYALTLTEVLRLFPIIDVEEILQHMEKCLPVNVKEEKSQKVIGQLLTYSALIRSNRLIDSPYLSLAALNLFQLSQKKNFIQPAAYQLIICLFSQLDNEKFKEFIWPHLKKELKAGWEKATPFDIAFLTATSRMFPDSIGQKFLKKHWGSENLVSEENLAHWKILVKQSTMVHPHVHPVCLEFLELILQKKLVKELWKDVVDENLFEQDHDKSYLGFQLVKEMLKRISKKKLVKYVISPKFRSVFSRSYANKRNPLHSAANELANFLCQHIKGTEDPNVQVLILQSFIQPEGSSLMQIMRSKEFNLGVSYLSSEAVKCFFNLLKDIIFEKKQESDKDVIETHERHQAVVLIGNLLSHSSVASDIEWKKSVLRFLFLHAYFTVVKKSDAIIEVEHTTSSFPSSLRQNFAHSFMKGLDSMTHKFAKNKLEILEALIDYTECLLNEGEFVTPLFELEKVQHSWGQIRKLLKKLKKHVINGRKMNECLAFQMLFSHLALQLFFDNDSIIKAFQDLQVCCKKCLNLPDSAEENSMESDDGPPWIEVLVDVLLSLLSQPSHHLRVIVCSTFPLFCPFLTDSALQLILDVMSPPAVDEPLLEEEEEEDKSDEEMHFVSGSSDDEENKEDEEQDNEEAGDDPSGVDEFKMKLQAALGYTADVEDPDVVLSDSDMFKLDDAIAEAFKSRVKKGSLKIEKEKAVADFKIRCLDLIDLYMKTDLTMSMALKCVRPILSACSKNTKKTKGSNLAEKATSALKRLVKIKKFKDADADTNELEDLFKYLLTRIHSENRLSVLDAIFSLCIFLVQCEKKVLQKSNEDFVAHELKCVKCFLTALDEFMIRNSTQVKPLLFAKFIYKCPEYAWTFVKPLEKYAFTESVRLFRRSQCLGLINGAVKLSKAQQSITQKKWLRRAESIVPKAVQALKTILAAEDIKPTYTTELLDLLVTLEDIIKIKSETSLLKNHLDLLTTLTSIKSTQRKKLQKRGNKSLNKLIIQLGGKPQFFKFNKNMLKEQAANEGKEDEECPAKRFKSDKAIELAGVEEQQSLPSDASSDHEHLSQSKNSMGMNGDVQMFEESSDEES